MASQALDTMEVSTYPETSTLPERVLEKLQKYQDSVMSDSSFFNDGEALDDICPPTPLAKGGNDGNGAVMNGTDKKELQDVPLGGLDAFDISELPEPDEDVYQWLVPSAGEELFGDYKSWLDTGLLDAHYKLLNLVKEKLFEAEPLVLKRSPVAKKISSEATPEDKFKTFKRSQKTPIFAQQTSGVEYVSNPAEIFTSPVRNRGHIWNEYRNIQSPMASPIVPLSFGGHRIASTPSSDSSRNQSFGSPVEKQEFDSRTFTRASTRNKLISKSPGISEGVQANSQKPVPYVTSGTETITIRPARLMYQNRNINLNETFCHSDELSQNISQSPNNISYDVMPGLIQNPNNMVDLNTSYTVERSAELNRTPTLLQGADNNGEIVTPPHPARNLSYIVEDRKGDVHPRRFSLAHNHSFTIERKEDTNNLNHVHELNTTFEANHDISNHLTTAGSNGSVNLGSLEELHTRARKQEESLKMSSPSKTVTRRDTHVIGIPNIDGSMTLPRPPPRTSSTDTYCVGQSNPDSPQSSGLSSPLDSQSYDDISTESFRRSMPNLAINKKLSVNSGLSLAPPLNSLQPKNYHTSDSKLSHAKEYSTLTITKPRTIKSIIRPVINDYSNKEIQMGQRFMGSNIQPSTYGSGSGEISRQSVLKAPSTGRIPAARYTSAVPKNPYIQPAGSTSSLCSATGTVQMQAPRPVASSQIPARMTSRIPGPGISRLRPPSSRPNTAGPRYSSIPKQSEWQGGCY